MGKAKRLSAEEIKNQLEGLALHERKKDPEGNQGKQEDSKGAKSALMKALEGLARAKERGQDQTRQAFEEALEGLINVNFFIKERSEGLAPLHFAASRGLDQEVEYLIEKGGKNKAPEGSENKKTAIDHACEADRVNCAALLMAAFMPDWRQDASAFEAAAKSGALGVMQELLSKGALINAEGFQAALTHCHHLRKGTAGEFIMERLIKSPEMAANIQEEMVSEIWERLIMVDNDRLMRLMVEEGWAPPEKMKAAGHYSLKNKDGRHEHKQMNWQASAFIRAWAQRSSKALVFLSKLPKSSADAKKESLDSFGKMLTVTHGWATLDAIKSLKRLGVSLLAQNHEGNNLAHLLMKGGMFDKGSVLEELVMAEPSILDQKNNDGKKPLEVWDGQANQWQKESVEKLKARAEKAALKAQIGKLPQGKALAAAGVKTKRRI